MCSCPAAFPRWAGGEKPSPPGAAAGQWGSGLLVALGPQEVILHLMPRSWDLTKNVGWS